MHLLGRVPGSASHRHIRIPHLGRSSATPRRLGARRKPLPRKSTRRLRAQLGRRMGLLGRGTLLAVLARSSQLCRISNLPRPGSRSRGVPWVAVGGQGLAQANRGGLALRALVVVGARVPGRVGDYRIGRCREPCQVCDPTWWLYPGGPRTSYQQAPDRHPFPTLSLSP